MTILYWIICLSIVGSSVSDYNPYCGDEFQISGENYCYMVSQVKLSWRLAKRECYKYNAQLVRIYDNQTLSAVISLLNGTTGTRWWTGLNDRNTVGAWIWGTKALATEVNLSVIQWIQEPDEANHRQNCAALNYQGSLSDERCWDRHRYICEYSNTQGGPCAESWYNYTNGCYLFPVGLADPFSRLTWNQARQKCVNVSQELTGHTNVVTHLLQLETQDELDYIRQQLPVLSPSPEIWWIGLNDSSREGQWAWLDGTPLKNPIWAEEPNNLGGQERCGYMNAAGKFGDLPCNNSERYICMKENDANSIPSIGTVGCPSSWIRVGQSCYRFMPQRDSWTNASITCQSLGSNLIKVDNPDKQAWLSIQQRRFRSGKWYWTGLNRQNDVWLWADNSEADIDIIHWNKEPNNFKGTEACALILKQGTFNDVTCLMKAGFICEQNAEGKSHTAVDNPRDFLETFTPNNDGPCPSGWLTINEQDHSNCYYISTTTANYDEAHAQCKQLSYPLSSYLVALNTKQELNFIIDKVRQQTSNISEWYTGLTDDQHEGIWTYDTSWNPAPASGFIPWSSMPEFVDGDENCVAVIWGGNYLNSKCNVHRNYICERPAYGFSTNVGSKMLMRRFSISSVFILAMYFVAYGLCLHYILHLTYVLFPAYG